MSSIKYISCGTKVTESFFLKLSSSQALKRGCESKTTQRQDRKRPRNLDKYGQDIRSLVINGMQLQATHSGRLRNEQ